MNPLALLDLIGVPRWIGGAIAGLAAAGALAWGVHAYNQSIRDALTARLAAEAATLRQEFQQHADASVTAAVAADRQLAMLHVANRQRIADARPTDCPVVPDAVRAAILRGAASPAGGLPHRP